MCSQCAGQLGLEHEQMVFYLTPVKALYGLKIRLVSCGSSFTVAATDNAQIFAWGDNRYLQCQRALVKPFTLSRFMCPPLAP
jgi:alpha-tubulin suppressor-like RCC1 family protein